MKVITAAGSFEIGTTEATPTIGITDFSRRVTDDFGVTTVVERGFSRRLSVRMAVPFEQTDGLQRRLADLRATSALWVASEQHEWLRVEGYYKEFELDLAVPPLSFCTLTVEGLAQTEVVADVDGDPAPDGQPSTLQLLQPVTVDDDVLVASNVVEDDAPVWSVFATYPKGAIVIRGGERFESLIDANEGHVPGDNVAEWLLLGPTNRWAMFDGALGTATIAAGSIVVQLDAPGVDGLALLDVVAATVRVQATGYDRMLQAGSGAITFLDLPAGAGPVTVTIAGPGQVAVGTLLIGRVVGLGITEASPTAGITDFSRKEVDDFGEVTVVQRAWAKRMSARALIRTDALDTVANRIATVRARPSLWIGQAGLDAITVFGFFKEFSIEVGENVSKLSLSIEGLSKAAPPAPPPTVNWPDVIDSDPSRPRPADGATVGAPPGTPVGDLTSEIVAAAMKAMADTADGGDVVAGARALVERIRAGQLAQYSAQLLQEERKERFERLAHFDGLPMGTVVRREINERKEGQAEIVETIDLMGKRTEDGQAFVLDQATVKVSPTQSLAEKFTAVVAEVAGPDGPVQALATELTQAISDEGSARAQAVTDLRTEITGPDGPIEALATDLTQAISDQDSARALAISDLRTEITGPDGPIHAVATDLTQALSDQDSAQAQALQDLKAELVGPDGTRLALATDLTQAIADQNSARAQAITDLHTEITGPDGPISAVSTRLDEAFSGEEGSYARAVQDLSSQVGDQQASVDLLLETVNGETANAQLITNVNGQITGFRINGQESLFFVAADRFVVGSDQAFEVVNGVTRIKRLVIGADNVGFDELMLQSLIKRNFDNSVGGTQALLGGGNQLADFSIPLGTINPAGTFTCKFIGAPALAMHQDYTTTLNGKPAYFRYVDDGGFSIRCVDAQGNVYSFGSQRYLDDRPVLATAPFDATFVAAIARGNTDTGWVDDGDYYYRYVSQQYSIGAFEVEMTWRAL